MKIIGFTGRAQSGKDTCASFIKELSDKVILAAYAKPLKDAAKILFNLTDDQLYDQTLKEQSIDDLCINGIDASPRIILQWLGSHLRKDISQDFFLEHMSFKIKEALKKDIDYFIVTDIRYNNEAELLKKYGAIIIKIEREGPTIKTSNHHSENGISNDIVDIIIDNNGTLDELKKKIIDIFINPV